MSRTTMLPVRPRHVLPRRAILHPPRRTLFEWLRSKPRNDNSPPASSFDPTSEEFRKRRTELLSSANPLPERKQGDLTSSSLFDDPESRPPDDSGLTQAERDAQVARRAQIDPYLTAPAVDPNPAARRRWLQRQVARSVRNQGVVSKDIMRKRREREHLVRSEWLQTSLKKLMPVARQIRGQTVDEALVQLRFSKKAVAKDVMRILEAARAEAIIVRGMGLGAANGGTIGREKTAEATEATTAAVKAESDATDAATTPTAKLGPGPRGDAATVEILDKKGKRRTIADPTAIYIDQAWIGRGPYGTLPDYRARGQTYQLKPPYTSISFLLKEEKTRLREAADRDDKQRRAKPWVHHPDRPITQQRQFVMW